MKVSTATLQSYSGLANSASAGLLIYEAREQYEQDITIATPYVPAALPSTTRPFLIFDRSHPVKTRRS